MEIKITTEYITLGQFLKHANLISTGGQARDYIAENTIKVNTDVTEQRGKKLYPGDNVEINDHVFTITR